MEFGPVATGLLERDNRRAMHLLEIVTLLRPVWEGLLELQSALRWFSEAPSLHSEIVTLLNQSIDQISGGIESVLSENGPRALDEARFLMEVEFLLYDFGSEPSSIDRWASLPLHLRNQEFGFGKTRGRREESLGVPNGQVLPDRNEYRVHSAMAHPRPLSEVPGTDLRPEARRTLLLVDLGDLLGHAHKIYTAALAGAESFLMDPDAQWDTEPPVLRWYEEAQEMLGSITADVPARPDYLGVKEEGFGGQSGRT